MDEIIFALKRLKGSLEALKSAIHLDESKGIIDMYKVDVLRCLAFLQNKNLGILPFFSSELFQTIKNTLTKLQLEIEAPDFILHQISSYIEKIEIAIGGLL